MMSKYMRGSTQKTVLFVTKTEHLYYTRNSSNFHGIQQQSDFVRADPNMLFPATPRHKAKPKTVRIELRAPDSHSCIQTAKSINTNEGKVSEEGNVIRLMKIKLDGIRLIAKKERKTY
jgi:hypothetical protein